MTESIRKIGGIANFQTIFNLLTAVVLIPFTNILVWIACKCVKDDEVQEVVYPELAALDNKLMGVPAVALGGVTKVAATMAATAKENIELSLKQFKKYDEKRAELIASNEERLDVFTDRADNYMSELSGNIEQESDNRQRSALMRCIRDVERIGDYATNFDEMAKKFHDEELSFSESAQEELAILMDAIQEILRLTVDAIESDNEYIVRRIEPLEEVIDDMVLLLKDRHTERLCQGVCSINSGLISSTLISPFIRRGRSESRITARFLFSCSRFFCISKTGRQKSLNLAIVSSSGITASTDFITEPDTSLKVDPDALLSIRGKL